MRNISVQTFVEEYGQLYSENLGIRLVGGGDKEVFKWFLASLLFGAPISVAAAEKTYKLFARRGVLSPTKILETGWEGLVGILDEGGYTRYDYKTADKLLAVTGSLVDGYGGSLSRVHDLASDARDLEQRLKRLAKGVGEVTVSIFLRELRGVWIKADPYPTGLEVLAAERVGILKKSASKEVASERLKAFWVENRVARKSFAEFETALVRLGVECRRRSCDIRLC